MSVADARRWANRLRAPWKPPEQRAGGRSGQPVEQKGPKENSLGRDACRSTTTSYTSRGEAKKSGRSRATSPRRVAAGARSSHPPWERPPQERTAKRRAIVQRPRKDTHHVYRQQATARARRCVGGGQSLPAPPPRSTKKEEEKQEPATRPRTTTTTTTPTAKRKKESPPRSAVGRVRPTSPASRANRRETRK